MSSPFEPNEQQLQPFRLSRSQFQLLSLISAGILPSGSTDDCAALEQRGFISDHHPGSQWRLTAQGEAILTAIKELLKP